VTQPESLRIGIIGGGFTGMTLAYRLAARGHAVTVYERDLQLGGLATYHDYGLFVWDRFYHCILPSDVHLLRVLRDLGLGPELRWARTKTGFFVHGRLYSVSSALEFLRFPLVGPSGKLRLILTLLYCARLRRWEPLEHVTAEDWLIKMCGRRTYHSLWRPLLLAKLGEHYHRVSAVFIWSYIKRLFSARDRAAKREHLGYVRGGYRAVFDRLSAAVHAAGGCIQTGATVTRVSPGSPCGVSVYWNHRVDTHDRVVFTGPVDVLERVAGRDLVRVTAGTRPVEYLGVVCGALVTRRPLVPFYVINIADPQVPFTGLIGMSNLVDRDQLAGYHLTYLPRYALSSDPLLRESDDSLRELFLRGLRRMLPDFESAEPLTLHINRALRVQPLQVLGYSRLVPQTTTNHPDFFVLNTAQFVNATLNNNEVARAVDEFLATHGAQLERAPTPMSPAALVP
jgi:protoporphyrinogen oxidase